MYVYICAQHPYYPYSSQVDAPRPGWPHSTYVSLRKYLYIATFSLFAVPAPDIIK